MAQKKTKKLRAQPENEDFEGKYKETNPISRFLVSNYFKAVEGLLKEIPEEQIANALEIGSGLGHSTEILRDLLGEEVYLEASEYVDTLVKKAQERLPKIKFIKEDVYDLKRRNNSIDLIFLLEVLEHLDYPEQALNEILRVGKKYLILGVPREPLWRVLNMIRGKYLSSLGNTPGHLNHWSTNQLLQLMEQKVGKIVAVRKPIPWTIVLVKLNKDGK